MEISQGNELNPGNIDGLFCPICKEVWTTDGDHHVCCLPCGHIFGWSCIQSWLQGFHQKCPQCKVKCPLKRVRKLFASRVIAVEEELQEKIQSLEYKCFALEQNTAELNRNVAEWQRKEAEWKTREALLQQELHLFKEARTVRHRAIMPVDPNDQKPDEVQNVAMDLVTDAIAGDQKAETLSFWSREVRTHDAAVVVGRDIIEQNQAAKERALAFIAQVEAS